MFGAVKVTVRVVDPDPVTPELTVVGATLTVQAGLDDTAEIEMELLGVTPVQLKPQE